MEIGQAAAALKQGKRIARAGWNGKGMYLYLQQTQAPWLSFVVMKTVQDTLVPWLCSQTDLLAEDWEIVEG